MSEVNEADTSCADCCASCGIEEKNDVKLKKCTACYLVKYCGIECQKNHRKQHRRECKKRAAELRDELLFKQPESRHDGDCPICCLPLPLDIKKSSIMTCCSKVICSGCDYADQKRQAEEGNIETSCPFCRETLPPNDDEKEKLRMKRVEANDPVSMLSGGVSQYFKGEYREAFDYYTKAADLGEMDAHFKLAEMYHKGKGAEKDVGKFIHHLEEAAIGGHVDARHDVGVKDWNDGRTERAVKHFIIAAKQGHDVSLQFLMEAFKNGVVEKDVLDATLRAHKAAIDATKSPQREAAEKFYGVRERV